LLEQEKIKYKDLNKEYNELFILSEKDDKLIKKMSSELEN
jgi:hypothetical protein